MRRMLRILRVAGMIVFAFGAVTVAPAQGAWTHEGVPLGGESPSVELTGTFAVSSSGGGVHCGKLATELELTGGTDDGHLQGFTAEEIGKCEVSGGLVFLTGGTTTLKSLTLTGGATATSSEGKVVQLSGISLHYEFNNGFQMTLSSVVASPLVATPDNPAEIGSFTLSGELNTTLAAGKAAVAGTLNVLGESNGTFGQVKQSLKWTFTQNKVEVNDCKFTIANEVKEQCHITFTVIGDGPGWTVEGSGWMDPKEKAQAEERYKVTSGCTKGTVLKKDKDTCTDVIEMQKKEASENRWCIELPKNSVSAPNCRCDPAGAITPSDIGAPSVGGREGHRRRDRQSGERHGRLRSADKSPRNAPDRIRTCDLRFRSQRR